MGPDDGSIVNIGSIVGDARRQASAYNCEQSPQGNAITVSHSQELAPRKIRVNALNPGMIETVGPCASGLREGEFREQQEKTTHLGRTPRRTTSLWPLRCWSATMPAGSPETACFSICARVPLPPMSRPWGCKTHAMVGWSGWERVTSFRPWGKKPASMDIVSSIAPPPSCSPI
jgi:hypothetical protein